MYQRRYAQSLSSRLRVNVIVQAQRRAHGVARQEHRNDGGAHQRRLLISAVTLRLWSSLEQVLHFTHPSHSREPLDNFLVVHVPFVPKYPSSDYTSLQVYKSTIKGGSRPRYKVT